ncbi:OmpA family protein [Fibrobacter sp.]|jgi:outer membrane protein OmpA-like peptidoglycan-associated protein|uniref:OmpA family protein n=1 Tax=Fibrobacter sp. TaxID=35828 RepID=UPI0025C410D5|nr:OmpA family protein [Fibrobacter sp.]
MKTIKILTLGALAASMSFAADAPSVTPVDQCRLALDNAKANMPTNAYAAKLTLAEGYGTLNALETIYADDDESTLIPTFLENCQKYAQIATLQSETQAIQNHISENWEKRAATNRTIEAIQEQIGEARSGKVSDLEAEKQAIKAQKDKLEASKNEAMDKLNALQSQMIQVTKDARGIILSMSDILFDVGRATLKTDLMTSLAKIAGILSVYQQFDVSIEGNTDNTGSEEFNMTLSQQRAENVMNFLVEQGIAETRLTAKGLGMTMPIADNSTKEGRQKNRRVDLVITDRTQKVK